jgi:hypothetical protein
MITFSWQNSRTSFPNMAAITATQQVKIMHMYGIVHQTSRRCKVLTKNVEQWQKAENGLCVVPCVINVGVSSSRWRPKSETVVTSVRNMIEILFQRQMYI